MNILLTTLNSKYIHTALALYALKSYAEAGGFPIAVKEFSINQDPGRILRRILRDEPELIGFSCNIWNVEATKALIRNLKKVRPDIKVLAGGPEVTCDPEGFLAESGADLGVLGEGEEPFLQILRRLAAGESPAGLAGTAWREGDAIRLLPPGNPLPLEVLPFPYTEEVLKESGRIFYYETSRGCPFSCAYCLSGAEKGVRFRDLSLVFADLGRLIGAGVRRIKFVDRTFNADPRRSEAIMRYILDHFAGNAVNFHMELVAELLDESLLTLLAGAPAGLFRAEVGIQSIHPPTLAAVRRRSDPERLAENLKRLIGPGNVRVHLDLIAGLPREGWEEFGRTFDWTYRLGAQEIQLGILKLLKGSELGKKGRELGYLATDEAPYEILQTPWLSFQEIQRLKTMARLVEIYHNSGRFSHSVPYLLNGGGRSPFGILARMAESWEQADRDDFTYGLRELFEILRRQGAEVLGEGPERKIFEELLRLDRALADWSRETGDWEPAPDLPGDLRERLNNEDWVRRFLPELAALKPCDRRRRVRRLCLEVDPRRPEEGLNPTQILLFRPLTGRIGYRSILPA